MSWMNDALNWYANNKDTVNPVVAGLGGAALIWAAIRQARTATRRHYEQTRSDQQRRLTESFSTAVEQLAADKIEARLGGIYTLERIAIEAIAQVPSLSLMKRSWRAFKDPWRFLKLPYEDWNTDPVIDLYWTVIETLTAFVRERAKWQAKEKSELVLPHQHELDLPFETTQHVPRLATDIEAVLTILHRRPETGLRRERRRHWTIDLQGVDLRGANLGSRVLSLTEGHKGIHLQFANLSGAHLEGANLRAADLEGANLEATHLEDANLSYARLFIANLRGASLQRACLHSADLTLARLENANLDAAKLKGTRLPHDFTTSG